VIHLDERHFRNLRQIIFGGQNVEGYWGPDGKRIVYQRMNEAEGVMCDQEYVVDLATGESRRVSSGKGRVTCGYLYDGGQRVLYASTHLADTACPRPVDHSKGYAWPMFAGYDIVSRPRRLRLPRLTDAPGTTRRRPVAGREDDRLHLGPRRRPRDLRWRRRSNVRRLRQSRVRRRGVLLARRRRDRHRRDVHPTKPASPGTWSSSRSTSSAPSSRSG
jgi:hypothetical protein